MFLSVLQAPIRQFAATVQAIADAQEALAAEEKAKADRLANPTTEDLLKDIKALLEKTVKSQ